MNRSSRALRVTLATLLAVALAASTATAQTKLTRGFNVFSAEQDVEIGRQSAAEIERQLPMVDSGDATDLVENIGSKLARYAPGKQFAYSFSVVDASDLNAFALPGGPVYVNRGVIEAARNEGELAGVLAHEIAHISLRHGTHAASKAYLTQAGVGLLGGLIGGGDKEDSNRVIQTLGGFGLNALFLKYSRDAEREADIAGTQMLVKAGYNPADMISFFETIARTDRTRTVGWLSSHPPPERRIERIQREASLLGVGLAPTTSTAALRAAQSELRRLPPARTTAELQRGRTAQPEEDEWGRSTERASRDFRAYRSPSRLYRIEYPSNWEVRGQSDTGVTLAPPDGVLQRRGRSEIVHGVIVNHYEPFGESLRTDTYSRSGTAKYRPFEPIGSSIEEATEDLTAQIVDANPHLRLVRGSARRVRLEGVPAMTETLSGTSPVTGERERVVVVTRMLPDDHVIYMLYITPEWIGSSEDWVVQEMIESLQVDDDRPHS